MGERRKGGKGKDTLKKNSVLFHKLSKGIKGLMNCLLDARG